MTPDEIEDSKRISRVMRAARKISGQSQMTVSATLGVSQSLLSKFESGLLMPSTSQWFKFCQLTSINPTLTFLTGYIDHSHPTQVEGVYPESTFKIPKKYSGYQGSKVRAIRPFLSYFSQRIGEHKVREYLKYNKVDPDFFLVLDNQMSLGFTLDLASRMIEDGHLGKKDVAALVKPVNQPATHGVLHTLYDEADGGKAVMTRAFSQAEKYEANFHYHVEDTNKKELVVSIKPRAEIKALGYKSDTLGDFLCRYKKHYFTRMSTYNSSAPLAVEETECHYKGADRCVYRFK